VRQQLDKLTDTPRALVVKMPSPVLSLKIIELALACELDPTTCRDLPGHDLLGVLAAHRDVVSRFG
jgi:hypothetical protein